MARPSIRQTRYYVYYNRHAKGLIMHIICKGCDPVLVLEMRVSDYYIASQLYYGWVSLHNHHKRTTEGDLPNEHGSEQ